MKITQNYDNEEMSGVNEFEFHILRDGVIMS